VRRTSETPEITASMKGGVARGPGTAKKSGGSLCGGGGTAPSVTLVARGVVSSERDARAYRLQPGGTNIRNSQKILWEVTRVHKKAAE